METYSQNKQVKKANLEAKHTITEHNNKFPCEPVAISRFILRGK